MDLFKKIKGTIENFFHIGSSTGPALKNNSNVLEVRNAGDTDFAKLRALAIQTSPGINDVPTLLDTLGKIIQFDFDGASAPAAGTNTGKFGFCHTTGGSYTANDVVYDDGAALIKLPRESCKILLTTTAITGTVSLNLNGVYGWSGTAYVLKGDGSATDTGFLKTIKIDFTKDSTTVDSTTSIPDGAFVIKVSKVGGAAMTAFNGTAPTAAVTVNGSSPVTIMATGDNNLKDTNQYDVEDIVPIGATGTGVVRVTVTADSSTTGVGQIVVFYTSAGA